MILDAVRFQKNSIVVSYYDIASDKIQKGSLSITEGEPLVWKISNPDIHEATITVAFISPIDFDDLVYAFSLPVTIECFYSHDGFAWQEFNHFTYSITTAGNAYLSASGRELDLKVMTKYAGKVFKVNSVASPTIASYTYKYYTAYNPVTKIAEYISPSEYAVLSGYLSGSIGPSDILDSVYIFKDAADGSLFDRLGASHIQLRLSNINATPDNPLVLNKLELPTATSINITDTCLTAYSDIMYTQKYFGEYPFVPSIVKSFFEMLETSDLELSQNPQNITIDYDIDAITGKLDFTITPPLALGDFFSPVFIWSIRVGQTYNRFTYTSLIDICDDVDEIISGLPNNTSVELDFAIHTKQFNFNKTKTLIYNNPIG